MGGLPEKPPRSGWAEDAARLAAERDDGLVWPEFPNDEDTVLTWECLDLSVAKETDFQAR